MEEELKALKELTEELAEKYDVYISATSFYGDGSDLTGQLKKDKGTSIFINIY